MTSSKGSSAASTNPPQLIPTATDSIPTPLLRFIELLEKALGQEAIKDFQPMQPGDVVETAADTSTSEAWVGFQPNTPLHIGLEHFAEWVKEYPELIALT